MKIIGWFSCGNNSAVMCKLLVERYHNYDLRLIRCEVPNEHEDNDRFHADIEKWIGRTIEKLKSTEYEDCWDVWERRKYIAGRKGAPCTIEMKKAVRWAVEREWQPDYQVFGFSYDEIKRTIDFKMRNPELILLQPLIEEKITKPMCAEIVSGAGIELPVLYKQGFRNNNCICCAKVTSIVYWARMRHFYPEQFQRMAELSRRLGARLTRIKGVRVFLDEIPLDFDWRKGGKEKSVECGVTC